MDSLSVLQNVQKLLNFFLRYVVAGGSAILAFGLTQTDPFSFLRVGVGTEVSSLLLLLFISVIGPAIYSVHRAFLHQIILMGIYCCLRCKRNGNILMGIYCCLRCKRNGNIKLGELDRTLVDLLDMWRADTKRARWMPTYEVWAAQIHFLYCSTWGIFFALLLALWRNPNAQNTIPIFVVGLTLLVAALVSDYRLTGQQIDRAIRRGKLTMRLPEDSAGPTQN